MPDSDIPSPTHFEHSFEDQRIVTLRIPLPTAPFSALPPLSLDEAEECIIAAMHSGTTNNLRRAFDTVHEDAGVAFRNVLEAAMRCERVSEDFREALHLDWTERGFRLRAKIQDDDLIIRAFRQVFPPYNGGKLVLYRGERADELEAGRIGLNWSTDREVAMRFARGLCTTYGCDGVLLVATAEPSAIITGPNYHSADHLREMEHVVDPKMLVELSEVERFPPST
ncbi:hypothetical protein A6U86_32260 [Rhizobium sp. AC27/96]|uniref:hypothetical protein n=1 Tax=Rhizobium sp. AC27/96 TaxID=1841653 RepID=UPI0008275A74|nr:hypothetical protein [Rhizobium sp. AC27/96]OCJ02457.1 hypothetical protein A6U86_32260 [Rhizobium sp. AC27/96]